MAGEDAVVYPDIGASMPSSPFALGPCLDVGATLASRLYLFVVCQFLRRQLTWRTKFQASLEFLEYGGKAIARICDFA